MPYDDDEENNPRPTEAEIEALAQQELALELAQVQAWARTRLNVGKLDSDIKTLVVHKIGTLNQQQVQVLQMQRTLIPFGVTPDVFKHGRAAEMFLTDEEIVRLGSPDLSDQAEIAMYEWALTDICEWLESQPDGKQQYQHLLIVYQNALRDAKGCYTLINGHPPLALKAINVVMTIARAKKFLKGDVS